MTDIAALGFNIDSSQADKATASLRNLRSAANDAKGSSSDFANATAVLGDKLDGLSAKQSQLLAVLTQQRDLQTRLANDNATTAFYTKWGVIVGGTSIAFDALANSIIRTTTAGNQIASGEMTIAMTILRAETDAWTAALGLAETGLKSLAGAGYWAAITDEAVAAGNAIRDAAREAGTSSASYRTFGDNAGYLGLSAGEAQSALKHLNEVIAQGLTPNSDAGKALKELGVELKGIDLKNIRPDDATQLFTAIATKLNEYKDSVAKLQIETTLLGTTSATVLKGVASSWYQVTAEAVRHNEVLDLIQQREKDFAKATEQLAQQDGWWGKLNNSISDTFKTWFAGYGPVVAAQDDVTKKFQALQDAQAKAKQGSNFGVGTDVFKNATADYEQALTDLDEARQKYRRDEQEAADRASIEAQDLAHAWDRFINNDTAGTIGAATSALATAVANIARERLAWTGLFNPVSTDIINPSSGRRERNAPGIVLPADTHKQAVDPRDTAALKQLKEQLDPALAAWDAYQERITKIDDLTKKLNLSQAAQNTLLEEARQAWIKIGTPLVAAQQQEERQLDIFNFQPGNDRFRAQQRLQARGTNFNRDLTPDQTASVDEQSNRKVATNNVEANRVANEQIDAQQRLAAAAKISAAAVQEQTIRNEAKTQSEKSDGTAMDETAFATNKLIELEARRAQGGNAQLAADREATTQSLALADAYGKGQVAVAKLTAENQAHQLVLAGTISKTQEMAVAHGIAAKAAAEATTALAAKNAATKIELEYAPRIIAAEQEGVAASQEVARQIDVEKQKRELLAKAEADGSQAAIDAANAQIAALDAGTAAQLAFNRAKSAATIGRESQQQLEDLNSEIDALKQGTREYEIQKSYIEAINRLKAAGIEPDLQTRITVQQYAEELGTARDRYNDLTEANADFRRAAVDSFRAIGDELGAVLLKTTSWKDAVTSLKDTLFKVAANVFITQPLERLATNATSGKGFTFGEDFNPGAGLIKSFSNSSLGKGVADFFGFGDEEKGTGASPAADRDKFNDPGSLLVEAGKDLAESATKQDNASEKLSGVPSIFERLFGNQLTTTMNVEAATVTVNAAASAGGGGGGGLGGLLGMFGGDAGAGGGGAEVAGGGYASLLGGSAGTSGALAEGGMSFADLFEAGMIAMHSGGVVGRDGTPRSVPMSLFYGAPRLHEGGLLMPDEIPAILQTGERVLSRSQVQQQASTAPMMAAARAGGLSVHIGAIHVGAGADPNMARKTGTQLGRAAAAEIRRAMMRNS